MTIIMFLMVFVPQRSRHRDGVALHVRHDERVAATRSASDQSIG
ncbi:low affinity iron permease family protein [Burkholderia sp. IMCC1007]|nr:low affinity iron permease family protein [Burkholderia sp. IMCC1007]